MGNDTQMLGIVQGGRFTSLAPRGIVAARLTQIQMQEARAPESSEIDLARYEGDAILIRGVASGGWVYDAEVVSQAGPILTLVVERLFGMAHEHTV